MMTAARAAAGPGSMKSTRFLRGDAAGAAGISQYAFFFRWPLCPVALARDLIISPREKTAEAGCQLGRWRMKWSLF